MGRARLFGTIGVIGLVVTLAVLLRRDAGSDGFEGLGTPAPDVELASFSGETYSLERFVGRPLVLNFWASWCAPCASEMPDFERVHHDLEGEVAFLGVNQRDVRDGALDLAEATGVTYPLAYDPRGEIFDAFGAPGMPTTVFIASDGTVVEVVPGQLSAGLLRDYIRRSFGVT